LNFIEIIFFISIVENELGLHVVAEMIIQVNTTRLKTVRLREFFFKLKN